VKNCLKFGTSRRHGPYTTKVQGQRLEVKFKGQGHSVT